MADRMSDIRTGWEPRQTPSISMRTNLRQGNISGWRYEGGIYPSVYGVWDAEGNLQCLWEAETTLGYNPIHLDDDAGNSIVPSGGSSGILVMPTETDVEALQDVVVAASTPTWPTGVWTNHSTNLALQRALWGSFCAQARIAVHTTPEQLYSVSQDPQDTYASILYWLRAASMVAHNHSGRSCVPLLMAETSVVDGVISV